ncbi:MAG TPA: hypothetical protein VFZ22_01790 [Pyrinomonadaceae bacterium]|nr:hypothetical protein [Pyrinomonadaceae bacterium]
MRFAGVLTLVLIVFGQALGQQRVNLLRSPKSRALGAAFRSGKLPEPMRLPQGNIDQQVAALAKAVTKGDDSSTAAWYAAILAAGYGVRDSDGSVMQTVENGQGLIMQSWEVTAAAKLYGDDYGVTLAHLSESFTRTVPQLKDVALADGLLEGIRAGAKSNHPAVRFWAKFIVEMGKLSAAPYDLLGRVDPAQIRLDAVQVTLILSRFTGDLAAIDKRNRPGNGHHARPQGGPCGTSDVGDLVLDYDALTSTTLFGFLSNRLGGKVSTYGDAAQIANVVLTVFKAIVSYAALEVEITMDGDQLVRTKTTKPGERRTLTAKLSLDPGKWQTINCFRPALNAVGLDVDVPQGGPLAGVNVVWVMVLGGDSRGWLGTVEDFFTILGGDASYGDGIVFFDAVAGADRSPAKQITDSEGVSTIHVVGVPQETDLSRRKLFEVVKGAGVRVDVQLKPMRIKDVKDGLSNIMDIAGNAFSFLTKDPLGGVVGTATETLYRSNWYSSQPFYFIVKDWEPCKGQWQGTITYRTTSKKEGTGETNINSMYWKEESYYEARAQLDGTRDNLGSPIARVEAHASELKERGGNGKGPCYRVNRQVQTGSGKARENTTGFSITWNPRSGQYAVSAPTIAITGSGEYTVTSEVKGSCNNPYNKNLNQTNKVENYHFSADGPPLQGKGTIDPAKPDEISGSDTITIKTVGGVEKTTTITWSLRRCQDQ